MATKSGRAYPGLSRKAILFLVIALVLVAAVPLVLNRGASFGGTDNAGGAAVAEIVPGYQPWVQPIWRPPSGEIESTLFALQAAVGGAIIGYVFGLRRGRADRDAHHEETKDTKAHEEST